MQTHHAGEPKVKRRPVREQGVGHLGKPQETGGTRTPVQGPGDEP